MKERYLSKHEIYIIYLSKCNIKLPSIFGNSKKRFLWTGLVQRYLLTWILEENAHKETQMHWYSRRYTQAGTMYLPDTMYQGSKYNVPGWFIGSQVPSNPLPAACLPSSESAPQVLTSNHCAPLCYITLSNDAIIIKAMIWDEKTVQCQETHKWMLPFCHQFLPRANNIFHWKLWGFCHPHPSQTYRICRSRFFFRIKYICQHQSDHDCNDVCMDSVARKEPRFLHLFTTLLLNRKYNPLPPIYYCKSDTFSVHCIIFLEKLFVGSSLNKQSILDYFGSKF